MIVAVCNTKKRVLKSIDAAISRIPNITCLPNKEECYNHVVDIIDTKLFKSRPPPIKKKDPPKTYAL